METVYKLVKRVDDKLVSIRSRGKSRVTYGINKWTQSPKHLRDKGYDLCILPSLETARLVRDTYEKSSIILECEARDIHDTGLLPYLCSADLESGTFDSQDEGTTWPTLCRVMAKKLKPIKEI